MHLRFSHRSNRIIPFRLNQIMMTAKFFLALLATSILCLILCVNEDYGRTAGQGRHLKGDDVSGFAQDTPIASLAAEVMEPRERILRGTNKKKKKMMMNKNRKKKNKKNKKNSSRAEATPAAVTPAPATSASVTPAPVTTATQDHSPSAALTGIALAPSPLDDCSTSLASLTAVEIDCRTEQGQSESGQASCKNLQKQQDTSTDMNMCSSLGTYTFQYSSPQTCALDDIVGNCYDYLPFSVAEHLHDMMIVVTCTDGDGMGLPTTLSQVPLGGWITVSNPAGVSPYLICSLSHMDGGLIQQVTIDTSLPVTLKQQYGALTVVECGTHSCLAQVWFTYRIALDTPGTQITTLKRELDGDLEDLTGMVVNSNLTVLTLEEKTIVDLCMDNEYTMNVQVETTTSMATPTDCVAKDAYSFTIEAATRALARTNNVS
jgi:hypothetical protein